MGEITGILNGNYLQLMHACSKVIWVFLVRVDVVPGHYNWTLSLTLQLVETFL